MPFGQKRLDGQNDFIEAIAPIDDRTVLGFAKERDRLSVANEDAMEKCSVHALRGLTFSLRGCRSPKGGGYREAQLLGSPLEAVVGRSRYAEENRRLAARRIV
jgi:hypothetical protein